MLIFVRREKSDKLLKEIRRSYLAFEKALKTYKPKPRKLSGKSWERVYFHAQDRLLVAKAIGYDSSTRWSLTEKGHELGYPGD